VISPDRFIARSSDREAWLWARDQGVTATMVSRAATPAGFAETVARFENPQPVEVNGYMQWGIDRESYIAGIVKDRFGIMPNDWLIAKDAGTSRWQMATPDGLSVDHKWIAEIKTSGKRLHRIPIHYMRQIQWQLYVTDAERCLFAVEERLEGPNGFAAGIDIECQWVDRNEKMIRDLVKVAEDLQLQRVFQDQAELEGLLGEGS
jgi:hypothetical protein